uniref:Uncharacterized protein n=1 Tax=Strongyloides stercoralis TaxID=6248 RepID=A0A0K0E3Y3_STRER
MPNLKRNSTCLIDNAFDAESDVLPPLKKPRLLSVISNRVKTKLRNLSFSKSLFKSRSKAKCDTIYFSPIDIGNTGRLEANEGKLETKNNEPNTNKTTNLFFTKNFIPINNFFKSMSYEDKNLTLLPPKNLTNQSIPNLITFDTNFTKSVIGNSQPNKRFRMEQEALAKNIIGM